MKSKIPAQGFRLTGDQIRRRLTLTFVICSILSAGILFRAMQVQLIGDSRLARIAHSQFSKRMLVRPRRGLILDRNGEPLAANRETKSLVANASKIQDKVQVSRDLARALGMPQSLILKKLKTGKNFVWIKRHMSPNEADKLQRLRIGSGDPEASEGLWIVKESTRDYPHGSAAAQTIGFVDIDDEGIEGIELWLNDRLRGSVVSLKALKDALGRPTFIDADAVEQVRDGEPVTLTIDATLQHQVEDDLKSSIESTKSSGGAVVVMDASSGELLALANQPAYDPNAHNSTPSQRRNRVFTDGYEPGSTVKPLLLAAALNAGIKMDSTVFGGMGSMVIQGKTISEAETHEKFGWITLKRMVQVSSNVGAARLALNLGGKEYLRMLHRLGVGEKTGSGFPGEISGMLPPEKGLQPLTTANIGFGQGLLVTPIQMVQAYAAFANDGWLLQPKILLNPAQDALEKPPRKVLPRKITEKILEAMEAVTQHEGTGEAAVLPGFAIAGKTGTAQTVDPTTRKYSNSRYIASFIGFAIKVQPKIVIFTMLDGPRGKYYAADTAAPLFRKVLAAVVNRFGIPATEKILAKNNDEIRSTAASAEPASQIIPAARIAFEKGKNPTTGQEYWVMPNLAGLSAREVLKLVEGTGVQIRIEGFGWVQSQKPAPGSFVVDGSWIKVNLKD